MAAYDMGMKGITYMRDGSRQGVLERIEPKKEEDASAGSAQEKKDEVKPFIPVTPRVPRPLMLMGTTYKADSPVGKMYVTVNHDEKDEPFEVFINQGKSGSDVAAMADALGRMVSFVLRIHSPVPARERMREIVSELTGIGGSRSVGFGENKVRSLPDSIAKVLARHCNFRVNGKVEDKMPLAAIIDKMEATVETNGKSNGLMNGHANGIAISTTGMVAQTPLLADAAGGDVQQLALPAKDISPTGGTTNLFDICPECGAASFAYEEGCKKCYGCGYSEC
jgi:ribonucleoside-diphosphate reductase alpha chain